MVASEFFTLCLVPLP
jgi:hypothetical protein